MVEIQLKDLSKSFDNQIIIDSLNLNIKPGELVVLLGPSGCGKTTTLKIIAGLLSPDNGDILFDRESVLPISSKEREAVLVFQDFLLFPHLNVKENIAFGLKMQGEKRKKQEVRVRELLELVNLKGYGEQFPHQLSGGQKQRVALARALAINPQVLLLDEPLSSLDANLRGEMQELIRDLHLKEEMTTIFVTHDRDEAMSIADRIAIMKQGKIKQYGTPEELYKKPQTRFVAEFFGKTNYLQGEMKEGDFHFPGRKSNIAAKMLPSHVRPNDNSPVELMIRPEFIELIPFTETANNQSQLTGIICDRKFLGERILYKVDVGEQILQVTSLPQFSFTAGDKVEIKIELENIWFLE